jgi:hypothetical protein
MAAVQPTIDIVGLAATCHLAAGRMIGTSSKRKPPI